MGTGKLLSLQNSVVDPYTVQISALNFVPESSRSERFLWSLWGHKEWSWNFLFGSIVFSTQFWTSNFTKWKDSKELGGLPGGHIEGCFSLSFYFIFSHFSACQSVTLEEVGDLLSYSTPTRTKAIYFPTFCCTSDSDLAFIISCERHNHGLSADGTIYLKVGVQKKRLQLCGIDLKKSCDPSFQFEPIEWGKVRDVVLL